MLRQPLENRFALAPHSYDHTAALLIPTLPLEKKPRYDFYDLVQVLGILRGENGCPWDRAQTHESIRINAIEEVYEMVDAIDRQDDERLTEEIGDVLMQAVFHTELGEERGALTRGDVLSGVCKKLISRHTHIFFGDKAENEKEALDVWDKNKQKEHGFTAKQTVADVPEVFPALLRAQKVQKRAQKAGWAAGDIMAVEHQVVSLAEKLSKIALSNSVVSFVIGGSWGLTDNLRKKANMVLSFSKFTFPHQLMRVVLLEQLYRVTTILNNVPYAK